MNIKVFCTLTISLLTVLSVTSIAFEKEDIKKAGLAYVTAGLKSSYPTIEDDAIKVVFKNLDRFYAVVPTKAVTFKISDKTSKDRLGESVIKVNFYNDKGYFIQHNSILISVDVTQSFFVAKRLLRPGHIIVEDDLEVVKESLNGKPKTIITSKEDVIGKEVAYLIQKDDLVTTWMIKTSPLIRKGDKVTIKLDNEAVRLSFNGKALEDGGKGDRIKVRSEKTRKIFIGKVIKENYVQAINHL